MKVTVLQMDTIWASPEENAAEAERLMAAEKDSDVFVLPEMWNTGFATEPMGIAEDGAESVNWMMNMAREYDAAVCGSVAA